MDQALDSIFQLDKHAETGDPADLSRICPADKLFHVLCLFHVIYRAFGFLRAAFTHAGVLSCLRDPLLITLHGRGILVLRKHIFAQHAVHDQIRIAADRRSKMQVFLQTQTKMSKALRVIARLLHAAQHIRGKHIEVVLALRFF